MGKSDAHIAECAIAIISRYGYKRTTMGDLADAAGISRQTLYNKFPNKEEVLRAAVRHSNAVGLQRMRDSWEQQDSLGDQLESYFQIGPLGWYDALIASPESADLMEGVNTHAADLVEEATKGWIAALTDLFADYSEMLTSEGLTPDQYADYVYASSASAKYNATSRDQLVRRLAVLKVNVLSVLER